LEGGNEAKKSAGFRLEICPIVDNNQGKTLRLTSRLLLSSSSNSDDENQCSLGETSAMGVGRGRKKRHGPLDFEF